MQDLFSKLLTYVFVFTIYLFIYVIIRMIFSDVDFGLTSIAYGVLP